MHIESAEKKLRSENPRDSETRQTGENAYIHTNNQCTTNQRQRKPLRQQNEKGDCQGTKNYSRLFIRNLESQKKIQYLQALIEKRYSSVSAVPTANSFQQ